jgi:hypothetical protein
MEQFIHTDRKECDAPLAIEEWGWRYHHLGIPTTQAIPGEKYLPHLKLYVSGFKSSPFGIEWMRFENDCSIHELIQRLPHIAFEVDNLEQELSRRQFNVITQINSPDAGIKVAMIEHNGAPIELIQFEKK